jgi:5-methylcytosine-specific restriction endonuclease McrA
MELALSQDAPETRSFALPPPKADPARKVAAQRERVRRVVTADTKRWTFAPADLASEAQQALATRLGAPSVETSDTTTERFVHQQVRDKIRGYAAQDKASARTAEGIFGVGDVLHKLAGCNLLCFYCREPVRLLYEYAHDPKQWTADRVDNTRGHTRDNFEIACLSCNIRRRVMRVERYVLTKALRNLTKTGIA